MSSLFSRMMGSKNTTSAVAKTLAEYSIDELVVELRSRGLTVSITSPENPSVTTTTPANEAVVTQRKIFNVLQAIDEWTKLERHRHDKDRKFNALWCNLYAFDWARTPKGYVCDANKSVKVGLSEYSKWEDANSSQILIIQHYDSERPGNYEKRDSWGSVPPVWAIAFSAEEVKELTKDLIAKADADGTLIHREPEGDIEEDEPWYSESHWLIENNKLTGVRILAKCTQDVTPTEYLVRFKLRGSTFEHIGNEKIQVRSTSHFPDVNLPLPATGAEESHSLSAMLTKLYPSTVESIAPPADTASISTTTAAVEVSEVVAEVAGETVSAAVAAASSTESSLEVRMVNNAQSNKFTSAEVNHYNDYSNDLLLSQVIKSPLLVLTNPLDKQIAIKEFYVEFYLPSTGGSDGFSWQKGTNSRIGTLTTSYYGSTSRVYHDTACHESFEVGKHSSVEVFFEGTTQLLTTIPKCAFQANPYDRRIHPLFPNPLYARVIMIDDENKMKSQSFSYTNDEIEHLWNDYESACQAGYSSNNNNTTEKIPDDYSISDGFGTAFSCDLWLCIDNPLDLNKCIISITTSKDLTKCHQWYIRIQNDRRDVGSSYNQITPEYLQKLAFKASLEKDPPAEIDLDLSSCSNCQLKGLVDYKTKMVYAFHAIIEIDDPQNPGTPLIKAEKYQRIDYTKVTPEPEE